jgi:hypothetical protein
MPMSGFAEYESYDALGLAALVKAGEVSATEVLEGKRYRDPILPANRISRLTLRLGKEPRRRDRDDGFDFGSWRWDRCWFG